MGALLISFEDILSSNKLSDLTLDIVCSFEKDLDLSLVLDEGSTTYD